MHCGNEWNAMLKTTKEKLNLLTACKMIIIRKGIRGVSHSSVIVKLTIHI